jgi:hypothetical protein
VDIKIIEVRFEDAVVILRGVKVKRCFPSHQAKGRKKSIESENVITVKVTDEDMVYLSEPDLFFPQL